MRLKNAELERELKQLREGQMQIMQAQLANNAPVRQEVDEFDEIGDEEFIPLGKVKKLAEKNTQKVLKNAEDLVRNEVAKSPQKAARHSIHGSLESSIFRFLRDRQS